MSDYILQKDGKDWVIDISAESFLSGNVLKAEYNRPCKPGMENETKVSVFDYSRVFAEDVVWAALYKALMENGFRKIEDAEIRGAANASEGVDEVVRYTIPKHMSLAQAEAIADKALRDIGAEELPVAELVEEGIKAGHPGAIMSATEIKTNDPVANIVNLAKSHFELNDDDSRLEAFKQALRKQMQKDFPSFSPK